MTREQIAQAFRAAFAGKMFVADLLVAVGGLSRGDLESLNAEIAELRRVRREKSRVDSRSGRERKWDARGGWNQYGAPR